MLIDRLERSSVILLAVLLSGCYCDVEAHFEYPQENHSAKHRILKAKQSIEKVDSSDPWQLLQMALSPAYAATSNVSIVLDGNYRVIKSNGLPDHPTGAFPNSGNPNTISEQHYTFRVTLTPKDSGTITPLGMNPFGVAINGIPFDPGAAEFWNRDWNSGWQYEAMALGPRLGLDQNNAHVQPNGAYHYHGPPTGLLNRLAQSPKPILLGYAADGFPIYGPYGHAAKSAQSSPKKLHASYRIKDGTRESGPGGAYDGTFIQDYEYVKGLGDLDECNGRFGKTPEYPQGIYHYVITDSYPYIPRSYRGIPDSSFRHRGGPGAARRPGFGLPGGMPGGRFDGPGPGGPGFGPPGGPGFGPPGGPEFGPPGGPGFGPPGGPGFGPPDEGTSGQLEDQN